MDTHTHKLANFFGFDSTARRDYSTSKKQKPTKLKPLKIDGLCIGWMDGWMIVPHAWTTTLNMIISVTYYLELHYVVSFIRLM